MKEEQQEELEVLQSIYEGDVNFVLINDNTFRYKYGEDGDLKSFVVEICWGDKYPEELPLVNVDVFYNKHLLPHVKEAITSAIKDQAEMNLGMSMTFTLFEWLKECKDDLLLNQPNEVEISGISNLTIIEDEEQSKKEDKKEHMTKAQKRRMWNRQNAAGERVRGYDWVDIVKHLSQTGHSGISEDS